MLDSREAVTIRAARAEDAPRLTTLVRTSEAYPGVYRALVAGVTVTPAQLARDVAFVAERPGDVVGFYALTLNDGPAAASPDAARPPELDLLFVDDAMQGAGLGRRLIAHLRVEAQRRGLRGLLIVSHPPAEGFYLRCGARRVGITPPVGAATYPRPRLWLDVTADSEGEVAR